MPKVYVVTRSVYDDYTAVEAAFSTREAAEKYAGKACDIDELEVDAEAGRSYRPVYFASLASNGNVVPSKSAYEYRLVRDGEEYEEADKPFPQYEIWGRPDAISVLSTVSPERAEELARERARKMKEARDAKD